MIILTLHGDDVRTRVSDCKEPTCNCIYSVGQGLFLKPSLRHTSKSFMDGFKKHGYACDDEDDDQESSDSVDHDDHEVKSRADRNRIGGGGAFP